MVLKSSLFIAILAVLLLSSCDPCKNLDCLFSNYEGRFRIVNSSNNNDLLFGPTAIYDKNRIRFYTLRNGDTSFFEQQVVKSFESSVDSVLMVRFFPETPTAFIRFGNGDTDTLDITYQTQDTRCCGRVTEITNFRLNNNTDIPGNRRMQVIRK